MLGPVSAGLVSAGPESRREGPRRCRNRNQQLVVMLLWWLPEEFLVLWVQVLGLESVQGWAPELGLVSEGLVSAGLVSAGPVWVVGRELAVEARV